MPALNEMNLKCVRTRYGVLNATTLSVHNGGTNIKTNQSAVIEGFKKECFVIVNEEDILFNFFVIN